MDNQDSQQLPAQANQKSIETVLALDFGTKKIGLAIGNSLLRVARPLQTMEHRSNDLTFQQIQKLVKDWEITLFVVGLPRHPDGNAHEMTNRCTRFGNQLHGRLHLPVVWIDERYTSATASRPYGDIDAQAAVMILEQYFSSTTSHQMAAYLLNGNQ